MVLVFNNYGMVLEMSRTRACSIQTQTRAGLETSLHIGTYAKYDALSSTVGNYIQRRTNARSKVPILCAAARNPPQTPRYALEPLST
jgi:hypothetical protein